MGLLTIEQAAISAQVSSKTIRRRIAEGRLNAVNFGTSKRADWRIDPAALSQLKPAAEPAPTIPPATQPRQRRRPTSAAGRVLVW